MTSVILAVAPLALVLGGLFWVFSFTTKQNEVTAETWRQHGVDV